MEKVEYKALRWAWVQPDNTPLPQSMIDKLSASGVHVKARTAGELVDERDPQGTLIPHKEHVFQQTVRSWIWD
jgi:hypothetical protein